MVSTQQPQSVHFPREPQGPAASWFLRLPGLSQEQRGFGKLSPSLVKLMVQGKTDAGTKGEARIWHARLCSCCGEK